MKKQSKYPAEFFVDGGLIAVREFGGSPEEVLEWLWQLVPRPFNRRLLVVRLALAQCTITDEFIDAVPSFGYAYDIRSGEQPSIFIGYGIGAEARKVKALHEFLDSEPNRLTPNLLKALSDPSSKDHEPYVDDNGFIGETKVVRDGIVEKAIPAPTLTTYGCKHCGHRYDSEGSWKGHSCNGIPSVVKRVNANGSFDNDTIPTAFISRSLIGDARPDILQNWEKL